MSEYRIQHTADGGLIVGHYVNGDPQPTPTERVFPRREDGRPADAPEAWINAFGRAAKHAAIARRPCDVVTNSGARFRVTVERIADAGE